MDSFGRELESNDLIIQAQTSYNAFALLYRRHYDAVFKYCVHRLFDRHIAEDITSQVFLKVVEKFHDFRGDERQFRNWLYTISTNYVNDQMRKSTRQKTALSIFHERSNIQNGNREESSAKLAVLKQAMLTLKPRYQTIITLRFFENLKLTEIAEVLGSSPGTVRSQLSRALAKLRKKLGAERKLSRREV
ncbi:MAG: sigma-70 family RNA polymerase sigma factor [Sedimentisphaerales bacterium]|nr:sigma-70 family RNA polymerase sigma factor [Sedimentisphaerales bacterium]